MNLRTIVRFIFRCQRLTKSISTNYYHEVWRNRLLESFYPGLRIGLGSRVVGPKLREIFLNLSNPIPPRLIVKGCVKVGISVNISIARGGTLELEDSVFIGDYSKIEVTPNSRIIIRERSTVDRFGTIAGCVFIDRDCLLAPRVFISSGSHIFDGPKSSSIRELDSEFGDNEDLLRNEILLSESTFVGVGATILPGCTLGRRSVVAAGSVVTKSFSNGFEIIGGVPAEKIRNVTFGDND
jgi:acetyltransferase-like isoleucine patch superfamily enzyme